MEPKYLNININRNQVKRSTGRALLIAMPHNSDYDGFTFWFPEKLVDEGRHDEAIRLCIPVSFEFKLRRTSPKTFKVLAEEELNAYQLVEQFQNDDTTVFLISLKAGGTGLNLTAAEAVIHFDPWWNMSAQNQATDRAYRIGQKNVVTVYKLVMKNSVEEKILELQNKKKNLADTFVENNEGNITSMSTEEIINLFSI